MSVLDRLFSRPATGLVITPLRRRDLSAVLRYKQQCYPRPWSRAVFESEIGLVPTGTRVYLAARSARRLVGYGGLWITEGESGTEAHVTNIAVDPPERRRGVATVVLAELARRARGRGATAWTLEVRASSTGAQQLYRRFGFAPAGVRTGYYENAEDAIIMWCHELGDDTYLDHLADLERAATASIWER